MPNYNLLSMRYVTRAWWVELEHDFPFTAKKKALRCLMSSAVHTSSILFGAALVLGILISFQYLNINGEYETHIGSRKHSLRKFLVGLIK